MKKKIPGKKSKTRKKTKVSYLRKPEGMSDVKWQTTLRQQIAAEQNFNIRPLSDGSVYGDYAVQSPQSPVTYKVALRSADNSLNFCSCPDFKTNQLGTCKHIEAVLLKIKSKRASKKELALPYTRPYSSVYVDYRGSRKIRLRIGDENAADYRRLAQKYFDKNGILKDDAYLQFEEFQKKACTIHPGFRCYEDALEFIIQERASRQRQKLVEEKQTGLLNDISRFRLFPYQEKGILFSVKAGRSILADDMGLGKTLQSIVATEVLSKHFGVNTTLIICPTSLKYQWKTEIEKFTGNTNVCVVEGNILARKKIYENNSASYLIVSYQMAANDAIYLNDMNADMMILDEAQRIKNWRTKTSAAIKRIKTTYALVLTGTPVENKIEDLYSLMQIVNPFMLGSLHHFLSQHQVVDPTGKVVGYKGLNDIGALLKDVMLRRTKKEVLKELPKRMDKNLFVPLTKEQSEIHLEYKERVAKLVHKWRRQHFLSEEDRKKLLLYLNIMRMVCDSTYIIDQETNYQTKLDELQNILNEILESSEEKVVIFSQWERMTRLVIPILQQNGIGFEYLHGGVPGHKRGALYKNFSDNPDCRVFLSTDAGGVGLNLQSASYVINLDIPWNPAVLEQRVGRIYRLGQKKNVSVINLISLGTIEHRMLAVLKFKRGVASGILDGGENDIFMEEGKFEEFMKSVEAVTSGLEESEIAAVVPEERELEKRLAVSPEGNLTEVEAIEKLEEDHKEEVEKKGDEKDIEKVSLAATSESPVDEMLKQGVGFLEGLIHTLSNREKTEALVKNLTETDRDTGRTYLKIPVSNTSTVENALKLIGGLFEGLRKK
jgi:SNF2 family DNA or RNA helicase